MTGKVTMTVKAHAGTGTGTADRCDVNKGE